MRYQIQGGTISHGGNVLLDTIEFEIRGKERIAIVGANGCGKSTLLRVIAGDSELDRDDHMECGIIKTDKTITIGYLKQEIAKEDFMIDEWLRAGFGSDDPYSKERFFFESEYDRIFTGFGLKKEDKQRNIKSFSGGEQVKIGLIHLLLEKPDLLILDEPTNHLDYESIQWLESYLKNYPNAVLFVSHDRYFIDEVATAVYEIEQKKMVRYGGNYSYYKEQKRKQNEQNERAMLRYLEEEAKLKELMAKFRGKQGKIAMLKGKEKQLARMKPTSSPYYHQRKMFLKRLIPDILGAKQVLTLQELSFGYDAPFTNPLSLHVKRGQKIGIIGENGAGKTTLLEVLSGNIPPLKGMYLQGADVYAGYYKQIDSFEYKEQSLFEDMHASFPNLSIKEQRELLAAFLFQGEDLNKPLSVLSGGEQSRVRLAKLLYQCPNLLLMDEPTNHLDLLGKEALEEMLKAYQGTLLFVTHDRYLLKEVADSLLVFEGGKVHYYPYGYSHYLNTKKELGTETLSHLEKLDLMQKEQERIAKELQDVPKPERHRLKEISEEEGYIAWKERMMEEEIDQLLEQILSLESVSYENLADYFDEEACAKRACQKDELEKQITALCIALYELTQESEML